MNANRGLPKSPPINRVPAVTHLALLCPLPSPGVSPRCQRSQASLSQHLRSPGLQETFEDPSPRRARGWRLCSASCWTRSGLALLLPAPTVCSLLHRFQAPADKESQHVQETDDGGANGEPQAR